MSVRTLPPRARAARSAYHGPHAAWRGADAAWEASMRRIRARAAVVLLACLLMPGGWAVNASASGPAAERTLAAGVTAFAGDAPLAPLPQATRLRAASQS